MSTPLIEFIRAKKDKKKQARNERRKQENERRAERNAERKKQKQAERKEKQGRKVSRGLVFFENLSFFKALQSPARNFPQKNRKTRKLRVPRNNSPKLWHNYKI